MRIKHLPGGFGVNEDDRPQETISGKPNVTAGFRVVLAIVSSLFGALARQVVCSGWE